MSKFCIIIGTKSEAIKTFPIIKELQKNNSDFFIINSNQNSFENVEETLINEFEINKPKYNFEIKPNTPGQTIAKNIENIETILLNESPDFVIIQGSSDTSLSAALISSKLNIKIIHLESGLRNYNETDNSEINRILIDKLSNILFCPTKRQKNNLLKEGIDSNKTFIVGNTIVDAVYQSKKIVNKREDLKKYLEKKYFLLTLHRPSNVDNKESLIEIFNTLTTISKEHDTKVLFPIHPRTKKQIELFNIELNPDIFEIIEPLGYLEMLAVEKSAQLIFTDSGSVQEEACILRVPTITINNSTERPETVQVGSNILVDGNLDNMLKSVKIMLNKEQSWPNPYGENVSKNILKIIYEK